MHWKKTFATYRTEKYIIYIIEKELVQFKKKR